MCVPVTEAVHLRRSQAEPLGETREAQERCPIATLQLAQPVERVEHDGVITVGVR
jgi:hypothetical protein